MLNDLRRRLNEKAGFFYPLQRLFHEFFGNSAQVLLGKLSEKDDFVDPVQKLRAKILFDFLPCRGLAVLLGIGVVLVNICKSERASFGRCPTPEI